jgi:hypothetical protein
LSVDDTFPDLIPGADVGPRSRRRGPQTRRRGARGDDAPSPIQRTQRRAGGRDAPRPPGREQAPAEVPQTGGDEELPNQTAAAVEPAEALARFLETDAAGNKTLSKSFFLPPDRAKALQLMRQELIDQGFTAREASMANMVSAMIDQWHEKIFGRPIGG